MSNWLREEGSITADSAELGRDKTRGTATSSRPLAIFLKTLVVRETGKWFGEAELRLDALVVQGGSSEPLFHPQTFHFPRVADGDDLVAEERGLLIYLGKPEHFVSISLLLARDAKGSDDLAALIQKSAESAELRSAASSIATLALPSPEVAAVKAGMTAALALGDLAYRLVSATSPRCLGLYRASWLAQKDKFGIGPHPRSGAQRVKDFEIGYEIEVDRTR